MSRLQRDIPTTVAALRMTRTALTLFVESKENDAFVYSRICDAFSNKNATSIEIRESKEIIQGAISGGKTILENLFAAVETAGYLKTYSASGVRSVAFVLDKDVDDVLQRTLLNPHVIYTPGYHVENLLVVAGNFESAVTAALSLNNAEVSAISNNWNEKCGECADLWKRWVVLCLLSITLRIKFATTYTSGSCVNSPLSAACDAGLYAQMLTSLATRSGLTSTAFDAARDAIVLLVDSIYAAGAADSIFKGKWYVDIVVDEALQKGFTTSGKAKSQKDAIWAVLRATFSPTHPVMNYFWDRLAMLV